MKVFKKGAKVRVRPILGANASILNSEASLYGVHSIIGWQNKVFVIEGTVRLFDCDERPDIFGAYLLTYEGKPIGYVYNDALEEVVDEPKELEVRLTVGAKVTNKTTVEDLKKNITTGIQTVLYLSDCVSSESNITIHFE